MTWYADGSPCDYFRGLEPERLIAVGWLEKNKPYAEGPVAPEVVAKVERLADRSPYIFVFRGFHVCALCEPQLPGELTDADGRRLPSSSHLNIFVPHGDKVFVAPECLPHYIAAHGYCPPRAFCDAVLRCPEPADGTALRDALIAAGGPAFDREFEFFASIKVR